MHVRSKWAVGILGGMVLLMAGVMAGLAQWAGSDDFRTRAELSATQALGVRVHLGRIEVTAWPTLGVALHGVRIQTRPPMTLEQIDATPVWSSLLEGEPVLDALVVRDAVLPQQGILAMVAGLHKQAPAAAKKSSSTDPLDALPRRIVLDNVTWVDASRQRLTVDAEFAFAGELLPETAKVDITRGRYAGAKARLEREGAAWQLRATIGGGTITGPLRLEQQRGGGWKLAGELVTEKVQVAALTAPSRSLTGKVDARTTLHAEFKDPGSITDAMRSQTRFTVRQAVLHGIDLGQAVRTMGISRSGQTTFDTLTGNVATQGKSVQLSNLVANSGSLSATGQVALAADRTLSGKVDVSLAGGALGVPVQVGGTMDTPSASPAGFTLPGLFGR